MDDHKDELLARHDAILGIAQKEVEEIKTDLKGMPEKLRGLEKSVEEVTEILEETGKKLNAVLSKIEKGYQSKEVCSLRFEALQSRLGVLNTDVASLKSELKSSSEKADVLEKKLLYSVVGYLVSFISFIAAVALKIFF